MPWHSPCGPGVPLTQETPRRRTTAARHEPSGDIHRAPTHLSPRVLARCSTPGHDSSAVPRYTPGVIQVKGEGRLGNA